MKKLFENWRKYIDETDTKLAYADKEKPAVDTKRSIIMDHRRLTPAEIFAQKAPIPAAPQQQTHVPDTRKEMDKVLGDIAPKFKPGPQSVWKPPRWKAESFLKIRKRWLEAYTGDGVNKKVWVDYLIRLIASGRIGWAMAAQAHMWHNRDPSGYRGFLHQFYDKNIFPTIESAIMNTKVYARNCYPKRWPCSIYVSPTAAAQGGYPNEGDLLPGIYIDSQYSTKEAESTFQHELAHAIDDQLRAVGGPRAKLARQIALGALEKERTKPHLDPAGLPGVPGLPSLSQQQKKLMKKVFRDMDDRPAMEKAALGAGGDASAKHSYHSFELYTNVIFSRVLRGLLTCDDIKRLRDPKYKPDPNSESDIAQALRRKANLELSDCEVAITLNQVARADPRLNKILYDRRRRHAAKRRGVIS